MRRKRKERTAHLRPFCHACGNTGLMEGPIETRNGREYKTLKKCDKCPTKHPTSADAPQALDGPSRAAGEKED